MNGLPLLFWLALALPGFSIARRWFPRELAGGALPSLAVAWMASLACLAPVVALLYVIGSFGGPSLRISAGALAVCVAAWIAWGLVDAMRLLFLSPPSVRESAWRSIGAACVPLLSLAGVLILLDVWLADRHGAILDNDSRVHIARIRALVAYGISNADPFVRTPVEYPYPIYHTNLLHALCAALSKLFALDPLTVWFNSLAASRLFIASGIAYLAWAVLGGIWAPWIAALMVIIHRAPYPFTIYPNQLAPWAMMPIALGVFFRTLSAPWRSEHWSWWRGVVCTALPACVVGMTHPLYAGFLFVVAAPVGCAVMLVELFRGGGGGRFARVLKAKHAALATLSLSMTALLFPLASVALTPRVPDSAVPSEVARVDDGAVRGAEAAQADEQAEAQEGAMGSVVRRKSKPKAQLVRPQDGFTFFERGDHDWIARTWGRGFTGGVLGIKAWRVWIGLLGLGCAVWLLRRREAFLLAGSIATVLVITMTPPLCTLALKALGAQWVLGRFETIAFVLWIPLSLPVLAAVVERFPPMRWSRAQKWRAVPAQFACSGVALLAIPVAIEHASQSRPYTIPAFVDAALRSEGVRNGRQWAGLLKQKAWMDEALPPGAVVLSGPLTGTWVSMLHGASSVASERSSTGIASGRVRRSHVEEMFDPETDEGRRAELFDAYRVTHVLTRGRAPTWARYWTNGASRRHGHVILSLRPRPDENLLWMRDIEIARAQLDRGNALGAAQRLRETLASHPEAVDAWFTLGNAQLALGSPTDALLSFERCEALELDDPVHALMHGNALALVGRFEDAIVSFERCAKVAATEGDALSEAAANFNMGNAYYELDRPMDALRSYERALQLDPRHAKARTARSWLRQDLGFDPPEFRAPIQTEETVQPAPAVQAPRDEHSANPHAPSINPTP